MKREGEYAYINRLPITDVTILTNNIETAKKNVKELQRIEQIIGLQFSYERTKLMTNVKMAPAS